MTGSTPPSGTGDRLNVSRANDAVLVQVTGLGNMLLAPTLQAFVEAELKSGFLNFVIDLRYCQGMDSTFMGTFIGLTTLIRRHYGWFCLVNVSDENRRLLKMLGVLHMVSVHDGEVPQYDGETTPLYPTSDTYARHRQILGAHKLLVKAEPENVARFADFIKAVEAEMNGVPDILPPPSPKPPASE